MLSSHVEGNLEVSSEIGIILPTYCEAANIEKLILELENSSLNVSILVIDDSSPDGTADLIRKLQRKYSNILLLVRSKKLGLGTAITDGFRIFLSVKKPPNCIVTMDADYSHNPQEIPKLLAPMQEGCDLVVGSRYCQGGGTQEWSIARLLISKVANLITRIRVDAKISDYTSGMRCYSTRLVRGIIKDLHSQTYEIQIETIRLANVRNYRIKDVPITFISRKKGKSKLSINEIRDFLTYIFNLDRKY
ncbi:MAG: polyprenol monophosphomannose synthase [Candidatus Bathyarchaeia archaeon]|jgi:dolichol-phosphate mannosyltransferase